MSAGTPQLSLAAFRFDVTPPMGHSLCGGWIKPACGIDDPQEAIGCVILGVGQPIVLCAVDWTGILNESHVQWRQSLAEAAGTTPDRVAVHCVHQHNAPFICAEAQRLVAAQGDLPNIFEPPFNEACLGRGVAAVRESLRKPRRITHIAAGQARVTDVASNRRVYRDDTGHVIAQRGSSCASPELRALEEGLIDPFLKTIAFFDGHEKVAALHYYATHPMSYYGDGRISADFVGQARRQRQGEEPACHHVYFTGCSGDIGAGKYNDGSKPMRAELARRIHAGMIASESNLRPMPIRSFEWRTFQLLPEPRDSLREAELLSQIADRSNTLVDRCRPAFMVSWLRRLRRRVPIVTAALHVNDVSILHLPAECFVEYQLRAQRERPDRFVAVAAYGDGGPWYIPTRQEFPLGGYESSVAFTSPDIDDLLREATAHLLK